jgi:phage-related protein (TIGR01555 family)
MHIPEDEAERRRLNERGREILRRKNGAVRPHREDGYVNLLNKYGTKQDNSEAYKFEREPVIPDMQLTGLYEGNGLFSKIIDTPAEEALKHGFDLNLKSDELNAFVEDALDDLEWEEKAATAIKWARLYGGALIVMLIDDGRGLEEPVDWEHIRSIDELRVYERSIVQPDYASLYQQDYGGKGVGNRVSKFGQPEYYYVSSIYGSFKVHESRCLVFRNGVLPEQTSNATYLFWGMPEYVRIRRALRETVTAHTDSVKLLERSVQAIYSMKGLASLLTTDDGENQVLKRLQLVDTSRGLLNSIAIDSEGEQYDFKTFQFSGVKDVIDATCNMLSALTNIPQTILFGRSPAGMNATGDSDFESYYNFVEKIQRLMLKRNLRTLLDVVFRAGIASGDVAEEPDYKLEFKPLWSLSDTEQAAVDQTKAQTALVKAQTAQAYVDMQALDPTEVRRRLASDEEFDVEDIISEDDEDDLLQSLLGTEPSAMSDVEAAQKNIEQGQAPGGEEQSATVAPTATPPTTNADAAEDENWVTINGTHVLIDENGVAQGGGKLKGMSFKDAKSQKGHSSETKSTAFSPATKGLDESYTGSLDAARKFNKQLYESHPEAFGSEDVFDENCRAVYDKRFGSVKFLYENAEGEEKNLYKKVSFEEWKKMDFEDQSHSYVDYDDFKKSYTDYYNEYAEKGSVVDGLNIYHNGAAKTGYGKAKGARKELDEKYGLSKFIDDNPDIHYSGGTLYRGVKSNASQVKQIQKALESGGTIDMRGCSSWTTQEYIAKDFCENSLKGSASAKHVVFIEEGNKERNAMPYPYSSTGFMIQNEVLYSGTAKFKPVKAEEKDGTMYVYVESE